MINENYSNVCEKLELAVAILNFYLFTQSLTNYLLHNFEPILVFITSKNR